MRHVGLLDPFAVRPLTAAVRQFAGFCSLVGPPHALVAAAAAPCKRGAARGRSSDRSQRRRYNWGHNTCAGEARHGIYEVPALPPQYDM